MSCVVVPPNFHMPARLQRHMVTHSEDTELFPCEFPGCNVKTKSSQCLRVHYKHAHSDERPFTCQVEGCEYRGKIFGAVTAHMLTHRSDRPFPCSDAKCGYKAKSRSMLNVHMKRGHGNVFYHCSKTDCTYKTRSVHQFSRHHLSHSDTEGFKCTHPNAASVPCPNGA